MEELMIISLIFALITVACFVRFDKKIISIDEGSFRLYTLSWNKPKPKTAMVEMLIEDIVTIEATAKHIYNTSRIADACRKTLESLK